MLNDEEKPAETFRANTPALQTGLLVMLLLAAGFIAGALVIGGRGLNTADVQAMIDGALSRQATLPRMPGLMSRVEDDPSFGSADAPVTIVEFSDFYCIHCISFANETLPQLRSRYGDQLRVVFRDMPTTSGQPGVDAAVAANCAHDQGKFWEFHNTVFTNPGAQSRSNYVSFAGELGMNSDAFAVCLDDPSKLDEITLDFVDGQGLGVLGTPAFFINGRSVSGAQSFRVFSLVIDSELKSLGLTPPN